MKKLLGLALGAALTASAFGDGANANQINKSENYLQTSSAAPGPSTDFSPYFFSMQSAAAAAVAPPGASSFSLPLNAGNGDYELNIAYATKAAMDAAYPNGTYVFTPSGGSALNFTLTPDLYPTVPAVLSGGTWQNGVLVIDPAVSTTLTFSTFATYGQGAGSHQSFQLGSNSNDNVNLKQDIISVSGLGLTYSSTPFTSFTIPSGTLQPGYVYNVGLNNDALSYLNTASGLNVAIFSSSNYLYVVGKPAAAVTPPVIASQGAGITVPLGGSAAFSVGVTFGSSSQPPANTSYIWYVNGQTVNFNGSKYNSNGGILTVNNVTAADAGNYTLEVVNAGGLVDSQAVTLAIGAASAPVILTQPQNQTANTGSSTSFSVTAGGAGPFTYQWYFNGTALTVGGTTQTYNVNGITAAKGGYYYVVVSNSGGNPTTSANATLTVNPVPTAPAITRQPVSQNLPSGATVAFNVAASGYPAPTYQWYFATGSNTPAAISGATSSRYVLTNLTSANAGNYSCKASNATNTATSNQAALTVTTAPANPGRLVNLSILSNISGSLGMGFVLGGTGTSGQINVLIRGIGPAIGPGTLFNVGGIMIDPTLTVVQQTNHAISFANSGWGSNQASVTTADNATGAFALSNPASADSALVALLSGVAGGYSATVQGKTGDNGNALTEVYDDSGTYSATNPRLVNLSCLTNISAGSTLDVGFVIGGNTAKTVLVRASGPAIGPGTVFNVGGVMADPQIVVSASATTSNVIAANAGWGGDSVITNVGNGLGAFAYTNGSSLDSAAVVTLEPGVPYAVQVNSTTGGGGNVLVEIYDVNP